MSYKAILKEEITCEEPDHQKVYASLDDLWKSEFPMVTPMPPEKKQVPIPADVYQYVLDNEDKIRDLLEYWKYELSATGLLQEAKLEDLTFIYMNCLELEHAPEDENEIQEEENYIY